MKIVQVLNFFLPNQSAGTEVYTWALSKRLQQEGHVVKIVIPHYGKTKTLDYVFDGLHVHQFSEPTIVDRALILGYRLPEGLVNFVNFLHDEQPDIVHFHELSGSNGISLHHVKAAKNFGAKVVMTFHLATYTCKTGSLVYKGKDLCNGVINLKKCSACFIDQKCNSFTAPFITTASMLFHGLSFDSRVWKNKLGTALGVVQIIAKLKSDLHELVDNCDRVVAIADWYKDILLRNNIDKGKIEIIKQGLPTMISTIDKIETREHFPIKLMFLGRISHLKGLHLLLDAINDLDESKIELAIFGISTDLEYERILKKRTANKSNVFWLGSISNDMVLRKMQEHDVLCLCSTFSEMSPLVIQEALNAGIPVLASGVYGNLEQIKHNRNGLIFQFNDVNSLRIQIQRLIYDEELLPRLKHSHSNVNSFEMVAFEYLKLYRSILNN